VRLPFGWWPRRNGWYPQPYFDPWLGDEASFDAYAPVREPWAERCPWCHSTYPFAQRIARASRPQPVGHGLEQWFSAAPGSERLEVSAQITTGISCESCHLGGRAHAAGAPIHFVPDGARARPGAPVASRFTDERRDPAIVNTVCAQCHSGPSPRFPDGSASRNSSEAIDLAAGPCTGIRCTDCHDPHRPDALAQPRAAHARAIEACVRCHDAFAEPGAARAHAGHDGVDCIDCHMPRIVMGIDRFVASHRISSPSNPEMLAAGAPNACNLCHLDRSAQWTLDELREQYRVRLVVPAGVRGLDRPIGERWLASEHPALRMLAAAAYARSPLGRAMVPRLTQQLLDPQPHVRAWAMFALEDVLGRRIDHAELDPRGARDQRARQLSRFPR
ncbi:MAG: ammonia-forming cytochrome c nitrite reductase subunit c552, partial [Kofleriaceae bacterium]